MTRAERSADLKPCQYCKGEPEPGWIETPNNGPIVPCPVCNPKTARELEYEKALNQRAALAGGQP
jgi:hypothetical protein